MSRENWSSKLSYILTVAGATIGFGSTWRFPYLVGEYGGGAFLLIFILIMLLLGVPLLMVESVIGRRKSINSIDGFNTPTSKKWQIVGYLGLLGSFGILSYYMVLGGWVLNYIFSILSGKLSLNSGVINNDISSQFFKNSILNGYQILFFTFIFISLNYLILVKGIISGIEKAMKYLMPTLFFILILIIIRSVTLNGAIDGIKFYLKPDLSKITTQAILAAMGQVFFALSLGFGVIITLSSYLNKKENIVKISIITALVNTLVAFLAGFMIFPAIFAFNLNPTSGPSLVFEVLPIVFSSMWGGSIFAILFFSLLLIAALTSSITIYEVIITVLYEKLKISRKLASFITIFTIFILGNIPSALSFGIFKNILIFNKNFFDFFDFLSANILLIVTSFLCSIFVGYIIKEDSIKEITSNGLYNFKYLKLWIYGIKYIIPIIIITVFLTNI